MTNGENSVEPAYTYNNNKDWQSLYIYNEENNSSNIESLMHYDNLNKNFHVKEDISYVNSITDRIGYTLESSVDINKGKNHSLRIDTLESSTTQTYLTIPSKHSAIRSGTAMRN